MRIVSRKLKRPVGMGDQRVQPSGAVDHLEDTSEAIDAALFNLMTPGNDNEAIGTLTPLQIKVLHQHPLLQHQP